MEAEEVHQLEAIVSALEGTLESLRAVGQARGIQCIEAKLARVKRRRRENSKESPAVSEAFLQRRKFEKLETLRRKQRIAEEKQRERASEGKHRSGSKKCSTQRPTVWLTALRR